MKEIKIKCPAKINLDLRVYPKDPKTAYHNIKSIMQTISLFDYITLKLDNENASKLIDTFGDTYGPFNWYTLEKKWIEAGNEYGKKIVLDGVSEENPLYQKVLSLGRGK